MERGRGVFAANCARCHSSQPGPFANADFHATDPGDPTLRLDWLGNDEIAPASEIGTYPGPRAALEPHGEPGLGGVRLARPSSRGRPIPLRPEVMKGGGRGYYRNISLLSAWAHAPFMHNNAIGPEICGKPERRALDFYASPYVDAEGRPVADPPDCWPFDPSVEGRYRLYKASMQQLLEPGQAHPQDVRPRQDIVIDIAPEGRSCSAATSGSR